MRVNIQLKKRNAIIYDGVHDVTDADSFGRAFATAWTSIKDARLQQTSNVGELMELISDEIIEDISGAELSVRKL